MFWVTAGYHRYFSHRSYKTSRVFQFIIAFMAQTSLQKGALWWASHHRVHHRTSDTPKDPHSMKLYGFWYSHIGWIMGPDYKTTDYKIISDYAKYPELVWLNKYHLVPPFFLAGVVCAVGAIVNTGSIENMLTLSGMSCIIIGYFLSTFFLYHGTFSINSIMHKFGNQRYESNDESKNNLFLALITLGEGWHNNHHYYPETARAGFHWWEFDMYYWVIWLFEKLGLVWDVRQPTQEMLDKNLIPKAG